MEAHAGECHWKEIRKWALCSWGHVTTICLKIFYIMGYNLKNARNGKSISKIPKRQSLRSLALKNETLWWFKFQNNKKICSEIVAGEQGLALQQLFPYKSSNYRGQPKAGTGHKMLFVPFVFSMSRFQSPSFRCNRIVVIVTLLEAIEGIPDSTKVIIFEGTKTSTIFTREYFMSENLRVDI